MPALKRLADLGWTDSVEGSLSVHRPIALAAGREDIIAALAEAGRWLAETKELERSWGWKYRPEVTRHSYLEALNDRELEVLTQ